MKDQWIKLGEINIGSDYGFVLVPVMEGLCRMAWADNVSVLDIRLWHPKSATDSKTLTILVKIVSKPYSSAKSSAYHNRSSKPIGEMDPPTESGSYFFPYIEDGESIEEEETDE